MIYQLPVVALLYHELKEVIYSFKKVTAKLLNLGVEEVIVAFDKQFKQSNDDEFKHLVRNLKAFHKKYHQFTLISFMFDKNEITPYKASPIDCGPEIFMKLYKERVIL